MISSLLRYQRNYVSIRAYENVAFSRPLISGVNEPSEALKRSSI